MPPGFQAEHFGQSFVETHLLQAVLAARGFGGGFRNGLVGVGRMVKKSFYFVVVGVFVLFCLAVCVCMCV